MGTTDDQSKLSNDIQWPDPNITRVVVKVTAAFCLGLAAVVFLMWSMTVPRGWGGGAGVPAAIIEPLILLLAIGTVIVACVLSAVFSLVALQRLSPGWGNAAICFSIVALLASAGQYLL